MNGELADKLAEAAGVAIFIVRRSIHEENKPEVSTTTEEIFTTSDIGRASVSFDILVYDKNPSEDQKLKMEKIIAELGHVKTEDIRFRVHEVLEPKKSGKESTDATKSAATPDPVTLSAATPWPIKSTVKAKKEDEQKKVPPKTEEAKIVSQKIRFDGDFEKVVGSKKEEFLKKCGELLAPLKCMDVYSGSVVLIVEGPERVMRQKVLKLVSTGLSIPNFAPLTVAKKDGEPDIGEPTEVKPKEVKDKKKKESKKENSKKDDSKQDKKVEKKEANAQEKLNNAVEKN